MNKLFVTFLLFIGFMAGWWSHTWLSMKMNTGEDQVRIVERDIFHEIRIDEPLSSSNNTRSASSITGSSSQRNKSHDIRTTERDKDYFTEFKALLNAEKFSSAMDILAMVDHSEPDSVPKYRAVVVSTLNGYLEQNRSQEFTELSSLYLSTYFDDVDVLLSLARFNKETGFYIEAVNIFQLAWEYAYSLKTRNQVEQDFRVFISAVDKYLQQRSDWYNLSQVYLQADIVGLLNDRHKLRLAEVLVENGDIYHAMQILQALAENSQVSSQAQTLLVEINGGADSILQETDGSRYASSIQLEKHGNQFLVPLLFSSDSRARLLIDTGASMTTLSADAFHRLAHDIRYEELGARMFSTANGVTKGRVLRVESLQFGDYSMEDVLLAVLDFKMRNDVDGLLGMNLLGRFSFQIEQDTARLLMTPR